MSVAPAIFARNHLGYLEEAVVLAERDPERAVTFRSRTVWSTAKNLLTARGPGSIPVYFAVTHEGPLVRFRAWLHDILLHPAPNDREVLRLLGFAARESKKEGLWEEEVQTLYVISGCHPVDRPFSIAQLRKLSDGKPLSEEFKYSYSIVTEPADMTLTEAVISSDIASAPVRSETVVSRIVRDTALVRRLKALHNDTCQLCSIRLSLTTEKGYSEGHHLRPLGRPHDGPDVEANIVIVCPNCHALLDFGARQVVANELRSAPGHQPGEEYLLYHNVTLCRRAT